MKDKQLQCNDSQHKTFIIAEVAQAHDGSLGTAYAFINAVSETGADAIKFQMHFADSESTIDEPWRIKFSPQDETRYEYWKRMEFSEKQWEELFKHARAKGLKIICSPFSLRAVELLKKFDIDIWKIASGEATNLHMINQITDSKRPVIISTGMSPIEETDALVNLLYSNNVPCCLTQCTSKYPCPPEFLGLNMIQEYKERYKDKNISVGLSDHSGNIYSGLAAVTLGADLLEVHVTFSKKAFGPDVSSSITIEELTSLCQGVRFIEKAINSSINKNVVSDGLFDLRQIFMKSIVANHNLKSGTIITNNDIDFKKPGTGLLYNDLNKILGKKLLKDVQKNNQIKMDDIIL